MSNLFSKDEDLLKSAPFIGSEILKLFEDADVSKISIFEMIRFMRKKHGSSPRIVYFGLIFLFSAGIIDFDAPYLVAKC